MARTVSAIASGVSSISVADTVAAAVGDGFMITCEWDNFGAAESATPSVSGAAASSITAEAAGVVDADPTYGGENIQSWHGVFTGAGTPNFTITFAGARNNITVILTVIPGTAGIDGHNSSGAWAVCPGASLQADALTSGGMTGLAAGDMIVSHACLTTSSLTALTAGTSFTSHAMLAPASGNPVLGEEDRVFAGSGAADGTWQSDFNLFNYVSFVTAWKAPSGGGGVPLQTVAPAVTGSTVVGSTLTSTTGTQSPAATSRAYQWQNSADRVAWAPVSGGPPPPPPAQRFSVLSAFNQMIPGGTPIHPDSNAMVNPGNGWVVPGPYQTWLMPRPHSAYLRVPNAANAPKVNGFANYPSCGVNPISTPWDAVLTAALTNPNDTFYNQGDACVYIVDTFTGDAWEIYLCTLPGAATRGANCNSARYNGLRWDYHPAAESGKGYGWGYGASGSAILTGCGMILPEDFNDLSLGSVIPHALRLNICLLYPSGGIRDGNSFVPPALGGAGGVGGGAGSNSGIPNGARIRLDPTINVNAWPSLLALPQPWQAALMKILRTLQQYGGIVCDGSGGPGTGMYEVCQADCAAVLGGAGYQWPWVQSGFGSMSAGADDNNYNAGVPFDLMSHFQVIDWTVWTGA
jgi:hypothetical protein